MATELDDTIGCPAIEQALTWQFATGCIYLQRNPASGHEASG
ncbi:MAG: hypothetical protein AAF703_19010 [Cyanobacteria bacterium P01_D01_bin.105]